MNDIHVIALSVALAHATVRRWVMRVVLAFTAALTTFAALRRSRE